MNAKREAFLAGKRPDDVHVYIDTSAVSNPEALEAHGERVDGGIVLLMDGDQARSVFQSATGIDPMALAQDAMATDGDVTEDCAGGICPDGDHEPKFIFSFAEEQNEEVGGLYADGDVIHAYVACDCGERYSDKWVASEQ
ncbi:DUF5807 family protein [Halovenus rubra]|uniref:DUF5807 family protein n=2 Tax=Halovenus rubra TaxID=869890 RepID=A0ABD5X444_9EURY|nr:DUF5807 family protein [Halovenus rubra]